MNFSVFFGPWSQLPKNVTWMVNHIKVSPSWARTFRVLPGDRQARKPEARFQAPAHRAVLVRRRQEGAGEEL